MLKALARSLVWWPGLDFELEKMVKECSVPREPNNTCNGQPDNDLDYIDYTSPLEGKMFLIVNDAHSKPIEVFPMTSATALTTVPHLRQLLSRFGNPDSIASDNGS